jgi:hypothetical protein
MNDYKKQLQLIRDALAELVSDEEIMEETENPEKTAKEVKNVFLDAVEKYKKCTEKEKCMDWKESMEQITGAQLLADAHGIVYTGKSFIFCPWCGEKIK